MDTNRHELENEERKIILKDEVANHLRIAKLRVGVILSFKHAKRDYAEAARWYRKAAEQREAVSQYNLGTLYAHGQGVAKNLSEAVNWYRRACEQDEPNACDALAWLLATCGDPAIRDGQSAVTIAEKAVAKDKRKHSNSRNPFFLDTLAAAYAGAGQFENAVQTEEEAISLCNDEKNEKLREEFAARLKLYQSHTPYLKP